MNKFSNINNLELAFNSKVVKRFHFKALINDFYQIAGFEVIKWIRKETVNFPEIEIRIDYNEAFERKGNNDFDFLAEIILDNNFTFKKRLSELNLIQLLKDNQASKKEKE